MKIYLDNTEFENSLGETSKNPHFGYGPLGGFHILNLVRKPLVRSKFS